MVKYFFGKEFVFGFVLFGVHGNSAWVTAAPTERLVRILDEDGGLFMSPRTPEDL